MYENKTVTQVHKQVCIGYIESETGIKYNTLHRIYRYYVHCELL